MLYSMGFLEGRGTPMTHLARLPASLMPEMAVVLATPGFGHNHWATAFRWRNGYQELALAYARLADPDMVRANLGSITLDDGLCWLRRVLVMRPAYRGSVPLWTAMALREARLGPDDFGVSAKTMSLWRTQKGDPLMGNLPGAIS